jgi:hypothetical protein
MDTQKNGAPGVIRTRDPRIRSPMLYPAELRAHSLKFSTILEDWNRTAADSLPPSPPCRLLDIT